MTTHLKFTRGFLIWALKDDLGNLTHVYMRKVAPNPLNQATGTLRIEPHSSKGI